MGMPMCQLPVPKESPRRQPRAKLTGSCELQHVGAGTKLKSPAKAEQGMIFTAEPSSAFELMVIRKVLSSFPK